MERILTVDELAEQLNNLSALGYGDMKIKCKDAFLHSDEISYNYIERIVGFNGHLFNQPVCDKVKKLESEIKQAVDNFYELNR